MKATPYNIFRKDLLGTPVLDGSGARPRHGEPSRKGIGGPLTGRILCFFPAIAGNCKQHAATRVCVSCLGPSFLEAKNLISFLLF